MTEHGLLTYTRACAWSLARSHARSGDRLAIAAYLGKGACSTERSPTSPSCTPTRTNATTSASARPSPRARWRRSSASKTGADPSARPRRRGCILDVGRHRGQHRDRSPKLRETVPAVASPRRRPPGSGRCRRRPCRCRCAGTGGARTGRLAARRAPSTRSMRAVRRGHLRMSRSSACITPPPSACGCTAGESRAGRSTRTTACPSPRTRTSMSDRNPVAPSARPAVTMARAQRGVRARSPSSAARAPARPSPNQTSPSAPMCMPRAATTRRPPGRRTGATRGGRSSCGSQGPASR